MPQIEKIEFVKEALTVFKANKVPIDYRKGFFLSKQKSPSDVNIITNFLMSLQSIFPDTTSLEEMAPAEDRDVNYGLLSFVNTDSFNVEPGSLSTAQNAVTRKKHRVIRAIAVRSDMFRSSHNDKNSYFMKFDNVVWFKRYPRSAVEFFSKGGILTTLLYNARCIRFMYTHKF